MAKIKITQPTYDKNTKEHYKVDTILDLGGIRNKKAVDSKQAVWVTTKELAKEETKSENTANTTEKVEVTQEVKKTSTSAGGKKIDTKKK